MTFWKWSTTAANNGTADSTCPFPEGMSPSAVNDGTRGMMAAAAKYRDDIGGMLVTAGTATAYTIFSNQGFDTLAAMHGAMLCFSPHITNGANGTSLNVDGKGPKPILTAPGVGLPGGILVQGTPYAVTYNNTDGAFYLHGYFSDPYNIPLFGGLDYWDTVAPNSSFIFPLGQAISRTTYAAAFARWGVTYGPGDGSTTFNVPNKAGRVSAMIDATSVILSSATMTPDGATLGAKGGAQGVNLAANQIPAGVPSTNAAGVPVAVTGTVNAVGGSGSANVAGGGNPISTGGGASALGFSASGTLAAGTVNVASTNASQQSVNKMPPTILCNYIIRIL
jgi:microcystin-dependent protein